MGELSKLKGLGPKSEEQLNQIGITTLAELKAVGPVHVFLRLKQQSDRAPSLNFLYAMVGAIENKHWLEIAKTERCRLLTELDGIEALAELLTADGLEI